MSRNPPRPQSRPRSPHTGKRRTYRSNPFLVSLAISLAIPAALTWAYATALDTPPLWVWLISINLVVVALMGKDKYASQNGKRRTPEITLILLTLLGATPGLLASRYIFNHKTSKESFQYALFGALALQFMAIWYFWPQLQPYL